MRKVIYGFLAFCIVFAFLIYKQHQFDIKTENEKIIKAEIITQKINDEREKKAKQITKLEKEVSNNIQSQEICICKAVISTVMGKDPSIMNGRMINNLPYVYYNRPDDGTLWKYKCKIEGGTVLWAMDPGRWRYEDFISYEIHSKYITIYDGSTDTKRTYPFQ